MARYERLTKAEVATIASQLNRAKKKLGLSLNELARRAGVTQPMAFAVSRGEFQMRTPNLRKLELFIHISTDPSHEDVRVLDSDIMEFLSAGGSVAELRSIIAACSAAKRRWAA